jgi:hypothetical protein
MSRRLKALLSLACLMLVGFAIGPVGGLHPPAAQAGRVLNDALVTQPFSHYIWQEVLTRYANAEGAVDFTTLRAFPKRLNQYLAQLEAASPENKPAAFPTVNDRLAYWLNAYNALSLRLILDAYPVQSLADVPNFETNTRYVLGGKHYALADIKNQLAHSGSDMFRLLFGLTHYTLDTPLIPRTAFDGATLDQQLDASISRTLQDPAMVQYDVHSFLSADCPGVTLGSFFKAAEPLLQLPQPGEEDQDPTLTPPLSVWEQLHQSKGYDWAKRLQKYAPPEVYAGLGKPCAHHIQFQPPSPMLRQAGTI